MKLPEFFIRFLTRPGDLVVDIFAGSNTTGAVAEAEGRNWLAFEADLEYLAASAFRFVDARTPEHRLSALHKAILMRKPVEVTEYLVEKPLFV